MDIFKAIWGLGAAGMAVIILLLIDSLIIIFIFISFIKRMRRHSQSHNIMLNYNPKEGIFYYPKDAWQKNFGYDKLYDENAMILGMVLDCEPVKFSWDRRRWLIELWKGQYDIAAGAEIGIYSTDGNDKNENFYPDTDVFLDMKMTLVKESETVFTTRDDTWWLTGFVAGMFAWPDELKLLATIEFPRRGMAKAFLDGLYRMGYSHDEASMSGYEVSVIYTHPKSPQPITRIFLIEQATQAKNRFIAWCYRRAVKRLGVTDGELLMNLEREKPWLYRRLMRGARTPSGYAPNKGGR